MQFYNLKTRSHVDVPEANVRKKKMVRQTKSGQGQEPFGLLPFLLWSLLSRFSRFEASNATCD
jgi:hypothetical protein